jgi:hypothetical protein
MIKILDSSINHTMKKISLLILTLIISVSLMAQLKRSLPDNIQASSRPGVQPEETNVKARGTVTMDFENFADFSLVLSPWTTIDLDGYGTYGITYYTFPHMNEPMSYIVFNPGSATPSLLDDPALLPHGGYKYAACFASVSHPNNDWLISPLIEIGSNGHLKFWVKSYTSNYALERYKVGVSTTQPTPASFSFISQGSYLEAPDTAWTQMDFNLSAYDGMDIFIGIQCVSDNAFILMLDDFEITSDPAGVDEAGWEQEISIYPNPAKDQLHINSSLKMESVAIYNMYGQEKMRTEECGTSFSVNLGNFSEGTYILQIFTEKGSLQRKINVKR